MIRALILICSLAGTSYLCGCSTSGQSGDPLRINLDEVLEPQGSVAALAFLRVCFDDAAPDQQQSLTDDGWSPATWRDLETLNLSAYAKDILEIPGGGSRVSETQALFVRDIGHQRLGLAVEQRFRDSNPVMQTCSVFDRLEPILATCAAIGKALGTPPATNRHYKTSGSRFISWSVINAGRRAVVSCEQAPDQPVTGYDGLMLSIRTDMSSSPKPQQAHIAHDRTAQRDHDGR